MILSFSKEQFKARILEGSKIHTIRGDQGDRWKPGMTIHFWRGNPRNVKQNPHEFKQGTVVSIERIIIQPSRRKVSVYSLDDDGYLEQFTTLTTDEVDLLARQDGFESTRQFWAWFNPKTANEYQVGDAPFYVSGEDYFRGKLIHWTDFKYLTGRSPQQ